MAKHVAEVVGAEPGESQAIELAVGRGQKRLLVVVQESVTVDPNQPGTQIARIEKRMAGQVPVHLVRLSQTNEA